MTRTTDITEPATVDTSTHTQSIRRIPLVRAAVFWIGLVAVAILNATVRELFVTPRTGPYAGHVFSTVTLLLALGVVVYLYFERTPDHANGELVAIGVMWLVLTVAFELGFGHYVAGESWASLAQQYNLLAGQVWIFVPIFMLLSPLLFGQYLRR